jgi:PWWP domain
VVDASVGTIVWVRRRNGSWWPGRILGPDELAESHLLSPRSGTPVKLLGRDDASV